MKYQEGRLEVDLCEKCPARKGRITIGQLRGSSFRGRKIEQGDNYKIDHCVIAVGNVVVANVVIANSDKAAEEHDADFIHAVFEEKIKDCKGPTSELTSEGLNPLCTPINKAIDEFVKINYEV